MRRPTAVSVSTLLAAVLVIVKHRDNIERLWPAPSRALRCGAKNHEENCHHRRRKLGHGAGHRVDALLARAPADALWAHSADVVEMLSARRVNEIYLPGFELPAEVEVTGGLEKALAGADIVLGVMPSAHARELYRAMRPHVDLRCRFRQRHQGPRARTPTRASAK